MRSLSGNWPASSWEPMSLSRALLRPTSSRTLRRFSHGIEKRRGVNASGNREVGLRLARDLWQ